MLFIYYYYNDARNIPIRPGDIFLISYLRPFILFLFFINLFLTPFIYRCTTHTLLYESFSCNTTASCSSRAVLSWFIFTKTATRNVETRTTYGWQPRWLRRRSVVNFLKIFVFRVTGNDACLRSDVFSFTITLSRKHKDVIDINVTDNNFNDNWTRFCGSNEKSLIPYTYLTHNYRL